MSCPVVGVVARYTKRLGWERFCERPHNTSLYCRATTTCDSVRRADRAPSSTRRKIWGVQARLRGGRTARHFRGTMFVLSPFFLVVIAVSPQLQRRRRDNQKATGLADTMWEAWSMPLCEFVVRVDRTLMLVLMVWFLWLLGDDTGCGSCGFSLFWLVRSTNVGTKTTPKYLNDTKIQ